MSSLSTEKFLKKITTFLCFTFCFAFYTPSHSATISFTNLQDTTLFCKKNFSNTAECVQRLHGKTLDFRGYQLIESFQEEDDRRRTLNILTHFPMPQKFYDLAETFTSDQLKIDFMREVRVLEKRYSNRDANKIASLSILHSENQWERYKIAASLLKSFGNPFYPAPLQH